MSFGEGKTAKQAQRQTMADQTPTRLATDEKWNGEVATKRVRVWADAEFRSQNIKWRETFDGTLELANLVLTPWFGLQLVADYRVWDRHAPGSSLADDLAALVAKDPADDGVFAVIGLTSSLPLVSATFDELGLAGVNGRHVMVRGYADIEERKLYADAFRDLRPEERELALEQRRQHKTAVVLLHELGHNLGYEHDAGEGFIMSASYSHRATRFSTEARQTILRMVDARLGRGAQLVEAALAAPPRTNGSLVFHITATGDILRDNKILTDFDLDNLLNDAFTQNKTTEIVIRRSRKAPRDAVERIVSRATAIGLTKVSLTLD